MRFRGWPLRALATAGGRVVAPVCVLSESVKRDPCDVRVHTVCAGLCACSDQCVCGGVWVLTAHRLCAVLQLKREE